MSRRDELSNVDEIVAQLQHSGRVLVHLKKRERKEGERTKRRDEKEEDTAKNEINVPSCSGTPAEQTAKKRREEKRREERSTKRKKRPWKQHEARSGEREKEAGSKVNKERKRNRRAQWTGNRSAEDEWMKTERGKESNCTRFVRPTFFRLSLFLLFLSLSPLSRSSLCFHCGHPPLHSFPSVFFHRVNIHRNSSQQRRWWKWSTPQGWRCWRPPSASLAIPLRLMRSDNAGRLLSLRKGFVPAERH